MSKSKPKPAATVRFSELQLSAPLLKAIEQSGYETPSPIQAQSIPPLLEGRDILGHAPTGTGKTAAFALPLLSRLDMNAKHVQILTLAPTRELAIQVAEAYKRYASHIKDFRVLPIYGGQEYGGQIRQLKRGVQVVVGTPGRVMDHMRKGTLKLNQLQALVLDEADEMLRMGFIEEVEWILEQTPDNRQMALFSATMPKQVERIAKRYLTDPAQIAIKAKTATAETIRQRFWLVSGLHKLDALTRILEVEPFDGVIIFVRTKTATVELADRLEARGHAAAAINGDLPQKQREQMVEKLKKGNLDILVATDVAARGLDVQRISHVINYDIPYDTEAYIHRIGRTGRAGRKGEAILFVSPRERRMLSAIERATRQKIEKLQLPSTEAVNNQRITNFKQTITNTLESGELAFVQGIVEQFQHEHNIPALEIAAALAKMAIGDRPLLMEPEKRPKFDANDRKGRRDGRDARPSGRRERSDRSRGNKRPDQGQERFRIAVGRSHGVKPGNIVGAIANEAGLDSEYIGQIEIRDHFSLIDLPKGMPKSIFQDLKKTRVCGQPLSISRLDDLQSRSGGSKDKKPHRKGQSAGGKKPDRTLTNKKPRSKKKVAKKRPAKVAAKQPARKKLSAKKGGAKKRPVRRKKK